MRTAITIIAASAFALTVALVSQYGFEFYPCELCIFQRWGYGAVILFSLISLKKPKFLYLAILALLATCGLAAFHFGVEQHWWKGFESCSSNISAGSIEELRIKILEAPVVRCDEPVWFLLGLSMAGWNVIYSAALSLYAIKSLFNRRRAG